ncbi:MAG TPA: protease inhibitor I42 family protein [Candidatus Rubrimentiphilum sp.]|nr:protease inhibitor I42 family protein [Candidatus Rubrimentiphilum sp.]
MKALLTALFAIAAIAPALADPVNTTVYTDPTVPVTIRAGQEFLIALPSNPTTGYSWTAKASNPDVAVFGSANERSGVRGRTVMGAGGQQIFVLDALHVGTAKVTFSYGRPWLKGTVPTRTQSFTIKITQ